MEKGSGKRIHFCSSCPQESCDIVLCGDCASDNKIMQRFDTTGNRKRITTERSGETAKGGPTKKKEGKKTKNSASKATKGKTKK